VPRPVTFASWVSLIWAATGRPGSYDLRSWPLGPEPGDYREGVDDPAVVAAIAAGELDGLATALDRYAAALYDYCYAMVPALAAEAVRDTFVVAWSSIDRLREPTKLYPWLQAVAGNECFRRALVGGPAEAQAGPAPEPTLPPDLPGQVLSACADNTAAGRAYRVSVAYRAGPFGHDGFPKAGSWPRAWRLGRPGGLPEGLRGRRRRVAAVAAVAAVAVLAAALAVASTTLAGSGGPRHGRAAADAAPASGTVLPTTPAWPIPSPGHGRSAPGAPGPRGAPSPATALAADGALPPSSGLIAGGTLPPTAAGPLTTGTPTKPPAVPTATPTNPPVVPTATVTPGPTGTLHGVLVVDLNQLHFVSVAGGRSIRTFVITAKDGPVTGYTISVPPHLPGRLTVSPSSGSLADGDSATITVTAASTMPFATSLTVDPGGATIAVDVKVNPSAGDLRPDLGLDLGARRMHDGGCAQSPGGAG
jgi:hypothetical protein